MERRKQYPRAIAEQHYNHQASTDYSGYWLSIFPAQPNNFA